MKKVLIKKKSVFKGDGVGMGGPSDDICGEVRKPAILWHDTVCGTFSFFLFVLIAY